MPILDKNNKKQMEKYNDFIKSRENTSITQDIGFLSADKNNKYEIVYIEKNEIITATLAVIVLPIGKKRSILYSYRGPIMELYRVQDINELMNELEPVVKENNAICCIMDPELPNDEKLKTILKNNGYKISKNSFFKFVKDIPNSGVVVNLTDEDEESILQGISPKARYNIESGYKKDITLKVGATKRDFGRFEELYKSEKGFGIQDIKNFETFKNLLKAFDQDTIRVYNASYQNKVIASAIICMYGNKAKCMCEVFDNTPVSIFARARIHFEGIKWGLKNNCKSYSIGEFGISENDNRFKEGFINKGENVEYIGKICKMYNKSLYYWAKIRGGNI